ncbi:MAG: hypothetical protein ACKOE2_04510 [Actinomycetales bacterium]
MMTSPIPYLDFDPLSDRFHLRRVQVEVTAPSTGRLTVQWFRRVGADVSGNSPVLEGRKSRPELYSVNGVERPDADI